MKTISFIGNSEPPDKLLELFRKFTPNKLGIWGQLKGEPHYNTDYYGVIDYLPDSLRDRIDTSKVVYLGAHPPSMQAYRDMSQYKGIKMYDCKHTFGFGEWWLNFTYDELTAMQPPVKTKKLGAIVSNADTQFYHVKRLEWLKRFTDSNPTDFDLHGRIIPTTDNMKKYYRGVCGSWDPRGAASSGGNDHMSGKEQVTLEHEYIIEFDAYNENHYFGERIFDTLLGWASPIYWGGTNLHQYLPPECFSYLDIDGKGDDVKAIMSSNLYQSKLPFISKARNILLNELQLWPRIHRAIFGINK